MLNINRDIKGWMLSSSRIEDTEILEFIKTNYEADWLDPEVQKKLVEVNTEMEGANIFKSALQEEGGADVFRFFWGKLTDESKIIMLSEQFLRFQDADVMGNLFAMSVLHSVINEDNSIVDMMLQDIDRLQMHQEVLNVHVECFFGDSGYDVPLLSSFIYQSVHNENYIRAALKLIDYGVDVNVQNQLIDAEVMAAYGDDDIEEDASSSDAQQDVPLIAAFKCGRAEIAAKIMTVPGVNMSAKDVHGFTLNHIAHIMNNDQLQALCDANAGLILDDRDAINHRAGELNQEILQQEFYVGVLNDWNDFYRRDIAGHNAHDDGVDQ